jgi:hypothetical protein
LVNPDNLALEKNKPNTGGFPFYQKNVLLMEQADLRDMFKNASQECLCTVTVISPDITTPNPSTSSAIKTSKNTEEGPDDPTPADAVDIQMECSSD